MLYNVLLMLLLQLATAFTTETIPIPTSVVGVISSEVAAAGILPAVVVSGTAAAIRAAADLVAAAVISAADDFSATVVDLCSSSPLLSQKPDWPISPSLHSPFRAARCDQKEGEGAVWQGQGLCVIEVCPEEGLSQQVFPFLTISSQPWGRGWATFFPHPLWGRTRR
jgi:hypothetical protein